MKIAVIGVGNMGSAIIKGLINAKQDSVVGLNPANPRVTKLSQELGFTVLTHNNELQAFAPDVIILTTPAPVTLNVTRDLANVVKKETVIISAAAGVRQKDLQDALPNNQIATIIPNTPVAVNAGAIGLAMPQGFPAQAKETVAHVLGQLGDVITVTEDQLDIVGVVGGCGPAFVDVFMDAMSDAAVKFGLNRQTAYQLIASMVKGSGALAADSLSTPAQLRDQVTSPAGTTIKGVEALEKHGFRYSIIDAVNKANGEK